MANRLKLNFSLRTTNERNDFLQKYLQDPQFVVKPPNDEELEMMGNYILWGKDPDTGRSVTQDKLLTIKTRHGTWDNENVESLDALIESPTFNECSVSVLGTKALKVKKEKFSREDALKNCGPALQDTFRNLFRLIDRTELMINFYELAHSKRKNPPRDFLLRKFTPEEQETLREFVTHWNQYQYLKKRHELVELRREQYTLRDTYTQVIVKQGNELDDQEAKQVDFDAGVEVLPLGVKLDNELGRLVFQDWENLVPKNYTNDDLEKMSDFYWKKQEFVPSKNQRWIDFREPEHVYQMFAMFYDLEDSAAESKIDSNLPGLLETLNFYVKNAELPQIQTDILQMKLDKLRNEDIAANINLMFKKAYTPNYISTIFRQRIIPKINAAARYHEKVMGLIYFDEEFKTCTGCGKTYLRDADNFTRKARSKDGFSTRCKKCEKMARTK